MTDTKDEKKRKILRFLGDKFQESSDGYFSAKLIAENCNIDETEVKDFCSTLENEGLIHSLSDGNHDGSYKIEINGLILLEGYSSGGTQSNGMGLSQFKSLVKKGLDKMQIAEFELQSGVVEAGQKHHLNNGLYYLVFIDLAGSTIASAKMNITDYTMWIRKFIQFVKDALNFKRRNLAVFVKSIGDGALILFRNFDDVLDWKNKVDELCCHHNNGCKKEGKADIHQYHHKTIIHLGEVSFDRASYDAHAFSVNILFKIEKKFSKGEIGITEAVKQTISPYINSSKFEISKADEFTLGDGDEVVIPLWKLVSIEQR